MTIWLDLANSPQVLFFRPILAELVSRGHSLRITTRDFAQTVPLADACGLEHTCIGRHGGAKWASICFRNLERAWQLIEWSRTCPGIQLALSHNSYSQALAAKARGLPFVTLMDYEHQPLNHLSFRLADRVIVPRPFPRSQVQRFGAARKCSWYSGLKEQVYLSDFQSDPDFRKKHGLPVEKILAVVRPPGPWAAYHRQFESDLFDQVLRKVTGCEGVFTVFLPRVPAQAEAITRAGLSNLWVPPEPLDGPNLLYHADLVISGGGTMNREAAVLGTPVYTVFEGKLGAVDNFLIRAGRMVQVRNPEDISKINPAGKRSHPDLMVSPALVREVTDLILRNDK